MTLTTLELGERLMDSCRELRPNRSDITAELNNLNMLDYWRDKQLFAMSCLSVILYGDTEPPEQIVQTRYLKQSDTPELYSLLSTDHHNDGQWYVYDYINSDVFGKPDDDGEVFYNTLVDDTVDKFQIFYEWSGEKFDRDSLFLGNIAEPTDSGRVTYTYNRNKTVTKSSLDYVFQVDRYLPFSKTLQTFVPPADNGTESCSGQRLVIKRYEFQESDESWVEQDYVLGYVEGSCGFSGYTATGTATSHAWSMVGSGDTFTLSNDTMTADLIHDGLIPPTSKDQKIVVTITADGTFSVSGSMILGFGSSFTLIPRKNILTFGIIENTQDGIAMDRNGTTKETAVAYFNYDQVVNGTRYKIDSVTIDGSAGNLTLEVDTQDSQDATGSVVISI